MPASVEPRAESPAPRRGANKWARIEALLRNRAFAMEYASARERWRNDIPAVFPTGYLLAPTVRAGPVLET